jgi:methionyl-tRNA formyltransferase
MRIDAGLDTGDILLQEEMPVAEDDTAESLAPRLAAVGAELLVRTLRGLHAGTAEARPQDPSLATLAPILKKEDGRMDFARPARELRNRLRGFQPWPGAFTTFRGKNLHVWNAAVAGRPVAPGELLVENGRLFAGCAGNTALELLQLQPGGKKRMPARDFIMGYRPQSGEKLGG